MTDITQRLRVKPKVVESGRCHIGREEKHCESYLKRDLCSYSLRVAFTSPSEARSSASSTFPSSSSNGPCSVVRKGWEAVWARSWIASGMAGGWERCERRVPVRNRCYMIQRLPYPNILSWLPGARARPRESPGVLETVGD